MTPPEEKPLSDPLQNGDGTITPVPRSEPPSTVKVGRNPYTGMPSTMSQDTSPLISVSNVDEEPPTVPGPAIMRSDPGVSPDPSSRASPSGYVPLTSAVPVQPLTVKPVRRKWLMIFGIIAAALIVLLGGAAAVYAFWYNNPDKVAADTAQNLLTSKTIISSGTIAVLTGGDREQLKFELSFDSKLNNADVNGQVDAKLKLTGSDKKTHEVSGGGMLASSGAIYLKFDNLSEVVTGYLDDDAVKEYLTATPRLKSDIETLAQKINGSWIKVDQDYIKQYYERFDYSTAKQCYQKVHAELNNGDAQQKQVRDVFTANKFMQLTQQGNEQVDGVSTNKYVVTADLSKAYDAYAAFEKTDFHKASGECAKSFSIGDSKPTTKPSGEELRRQQQDLDKVKLGLNISQFGHELKRATVNYEDNESKTSVTSTVNFAQNRPVDVADPEKSVSIKELQADIEKIQRELERAYRMGNEGNDRYKEVGTTITERAQNSERRSDLLAIQKQLEAYYATADKYPTLTELNDKSFRTANKIILEEEILKDPTGTVTALVATPAKGVYSYSVANMLTEECKEYGYEQNECWTYELSAILSDGKTPYELKSIL